MDFPFYRFRIIPLQDEERDIFGSQTEGESHRLRMYLRRRIRFMKIDVEPDAIFIGIRDAGSPAARLS